MQELTMETKEFFHLRNTDSISQERLNLLKKQENGTIRM